MDFPRASKVASRLLWLDAAASTNEVLAERIRSESSSSWPDFSVVVTDAQTAGRGRLGRSWEAPSGTMLAISLVLHPMFARVESLGWIPLVAGLAMARALTANGVEARLKWPNDVLISGHKVCGILAEAQPSGTVVVGAGVNLTLKSSDLPVPSATSMLIEGGVTDPDRVLEAYLLEFRAVYGRLAATQGDAGASGTRIDVAEWCSTLGRAVRVQLPSGPDLLGIAEGLDPEGRLIVVSDGRRTVVSAGDVTHLRY